MNAPFSLRSLSFLSSSRMGQMLLYRGHTLSTWYTRRQARGPDRLHCSSVAGTRVPEESLRETSSDGGHIKAIGLQELTNVSLEAERWSPPTSFMME